MKLIFEMPDGSSRRVLFPRVGEWQSGEIREIDDGIAEPLLKHHGAFIHKVGESKPKKKKKPEIEPKVVANDLKEAVEEATVKVEDFYKVEDEGGEI